MDYKLLAQKYIKYGIEWLESEFDTYKGMTTIMDRRKPKWRTIKNVV